MFGRCLLPGCLLLGFSLLAMLTGLLSAASAAAQTQLSGFEMAKAMVDRVVRITGRHSPGVPGQTGYGLIVGEETNARGDQVLVIVAPYSVVHDPERPGTLFEPPSIAFAAEPLRLVTGQLLAEQLPPDRGNIALITVSKPASFRPTQAIMAEPGTVLPGVPVWQAGNSNDFQPTTVSARLAYQDQVGWLLFEGIDNAPAAIGAAMVGEHGLIGLAMGASPQDPIVTRVVPLPFVALRVRAWGHNWDIPVETSPGARGIAVGPTRYNTNRQVDGMALAPLSMVPLLPSEATARGSWTPPGAKIYTWREQPARLFGSPRREATVLGVLPAGRYLPDELWRNGAYDIVNKIDGGAWFQVATSGDNLGFVNGSDVVEVWPPLEVAGLSGGKVVREWVAAGGKPALLRDVGTAFELETTAACDRPRCLSTVVFTPAPPEAGSIVPAFQMAPLRGLWRKGDLVSIRALLPRRAVETRDTVIYACVGSDDGCTETRLYPPATP